MINIYVDNDNLNYLYPILDTLKSGSNNYEFNKIFNIIYIIFIKVKIFLVRIEKKIKFVFNNS